MRSMASDWGEYPMRTCFGDETRIEFRFVASSLTNVVCRNHWDRLSNYLTAVNGYINVI